MKVPGVSVHPRVSGGYASLTSLLVSEELLIFLKSASFRRFFMALALLFLLLPAPPVEAGVTACPIGERLFDGNCYKCNGGIGDDSYVFDVLPPYEPTDGRACFIDTDAIYDSNFDFDCPEGSYADGNNCYTCPTKLIKVLGQNRCAGEDTHPGVACGSRSWNPNNVCVFGVCVDLGSWSYTGGAPNAPCNGLGINGTRYYKGCPDSSWNTNVFPTWGEYNKCSKPVNVAATFTGSRGCPAGTFDGLNGKCYTCPAGTGQFGLGANCRGRKSADLVALKKSTERCVGLGQGNCGLDVNGRQMDCDLLGECRSDPPRVGEFCGAGVSCALNPDDPADEDLWFNEEDDLASGRLACAGGFLGIASRCVVKKGSGGTCKPLDINVCADDMICGIDGFCAHVPRLEGERCDPVLQPCAEIIHPHETDPDGILKDIYLTCHQDPGQPWLCGKPKASGEKCSGSGQGSCDRGNLCLRTYDRNNPDEPVASRCVPKLEGTFGSNGVEECKAFYSVITAKNVNDGATHRALSFGYGSSAAILLSSSIETGVVYGPTKDKDGKPIATAPHGEFGCYQTTCLGAEFSAGVSDSGCVGWDTKFPDNGEQTWEVFAEISAGDGVEGGISYATTFENEGGTTSIGGSGCVSVGLGIGPPVTGGNAFCTTTVLKVNMDEAYCKAYPAECEGGTGQTGGLTDDDGDGDVAGTTCGSTPVSVRPKSGKLQLTWPPYASAASYFIRRSEVGPDAGYETVVEGHQTTYATYLDEGRTNGVTYWYKIAPKDAVGTEMCTTEVASGTPAARTRTR